MKINISTKLLPIIIVGVAALSVTFLGFSLFTQKANVKKTTSDAIRAAQKTFYNLVENDVKMLQIGITAFSTNQDFKDIFLENDRNKLYRYGQDLFSKHEKMGVTHFYFIRKNGTVLSRLHNPGTYDDKVTRATFQKSKKERSWGTGIELGKTAFALRVVHPYFSNNALIGYVEFGEEINHFLRTMKNQTGHEYGIIVEKKYIDSEKWASVRSVKGLRNNYYDLEHHVIIETTMEDAQTFHKNSFSTKDLATVPNNGHIFNRFQLDNQSYVSGGFALHDAAGKKVGTVVVIQDITSTVKTANKNNLNVILITFLGTILLCLALIFLVRRIIVAPLNKLVEATTRVVGGDFNVTAAVYSKDEIGNLAKMLNGVSQVISSTGLELEVAQRELDISEKLRKSSEKNLNLIKQRIRAKQRIQQRENRNNE